MAKIHANEVAQSAPIAIGLEKNSTCGHLENMGKLNKLSYQKSLGVPNQVNGQIVHATTTIHKHFERC